MKKLILAAIGVVVTIALLAGSSGRTSGGGPTTPGSTTSNAIARWGNTTGTELKNTDITIDDSDNMVFPLGKRILMQVAGATKIFLNPSAGILFANDHGVEWSSTSASGDNHSVGISFKAAGVAQADSATKGDGEGALFAKWWSTKIGANVASATTITPTGGTFHVTGTTTVSTINLPYTGFTGSITIIPDGVFSTNTSGNIALVSLSVVSRPLIMTYDGTSWYPSY